MRQRMYMAESRPTVGSILSGDHNADFWERYFRVMISAEVFVDKFMGG